MAGELNQLLGEMTTGNEVQHLCAMVRRADHRGSDVRLWCQELAQHPRQACPYPAFRWAWKTTQSYAWKTSGQHINLLEVRAFLYFLLHESESVRFGAKRFLHVFDSQVAAAVVAKGRSSSTKLNALLKRIAAVLLATDAYPFALWTLSKWNYSDQASRAAGRHQAE